MSLDTSRTAWISQGFERLVKRVRADPAVIHFDVLVVGSGYGGAVAAATFAGRSHDNKAVTVGVLERGKEYLPGSFPTGPGELPRYIRRESYKEGLYDLRFGAGVTAIVANGVGGGSLINAGVMEVPLPAVFQNGWPAALADLSAWKPYYDRAAEMLGARVDHAANTIDRHVDGLPRKFKAIQELAPGKTFRPAAITIAMKNSTSSANVELNKCIRCGDCATGCNFGAKNSLDVNLLVSAYKQGAEIFSGATVLSVRKGDDGNWIVEATYTNATLRKRDGDSLKISARKVILAAGTLGSSEILLRSQAQGLSVSEKLGKRCSTNGDMLVTDYATGASVNAVADETIKPSDRKVGPTITGVVDLRETAGLLIEEMAVPASLRLAFAEVFSTINTLHSLDTIDWSQHGKGFNADEYSALRDRIEKSALYAVMGNDCAAGEVVVDRKALCTKDGIAQIHWQKLPDHALFDKEVEAVAELTKGSGGRVIANPFWKLLPSDMAWLLKDKRGPVMTVHPLGGCTMADTGAAGVVDHRGRVFVDSSSDDVHGGLVVLDGSIIPSALGTNPALTIAAVALRSAEALADEWGFSAGAQPDAEAPLVRPMFRAADVAAAPSRTEVEIVERLVGPVALRQQNGRAKRYVVELTLRFRPKAIAELLPGDGGDATLEVADDQSELLTRSAIRIFPLGLWRRLERSWDPPGTREQKLDAITVFRAPLTGTLKVLHQSQSSALGRIWRAGTAWLLNRGLRDIYQAIVDREPGSGLLSRIKSGIALASHSGAIRTFVYDLAIGPPDAGSKIGLGGNQIVATKTFTYTRRGNPWRQLMEASLERFPGLSERGERVLRLDVGYLARIRVPLFRITSQQDGARTISDVLAFFGYFVRLLLGIHIWSFRAPDRDKEAANNVVNFHPPAKLCLSDGREVAAEIIRIPLPPEKPDLGTEPVAGEVLVTRYRQNGFKPKSENGRKPKPVVLLHGYSAGGTTFAHHAVDPNLASFLCEAGRDVWVADLRTSPAHATAKQPWSFDQIGKEDVRRVIDCAAKASDDGSVDVVAHCMGTVVFSIAVLSNCIPNRVHKAVLTQVGPLVVFTPANVFRGYVARYLIDFLPDAYDFNPKNPTLADDLWDRVLSSLPYPVEEFDVENPVRFWQRTPWTRTRHRMDALYGRDFNVVNMEPGMLRYIDEHFGALSLKTMTTTLHFVRNAMMTNHSGRNDLVSRARLSKLWNFPTMSVHGEENGLSHLSTVNRMSTILEDAGRVYVEPFINPGAGHQDALIGTTRHATFEHIRQFLDLDVREGAKAAESGYSAYPPWIGPILTEEWSATNPEDLPSLTLRVGSSPSHRAAEGVVILRVRVEGDDIMPPDEQRWTVESIEARMVLYGSPKLAKDRWEAFKAPLPQKMPGHDPQHPGNAFLVLMVYAENPSLDTNTDGGAYSGSDQERNSVSSRQQGRFQTKANADNSENFKRVAEAVFTALELPLVQTRRKKSGVRLHKRLHVRARRGKSAFKLDVGSERVIDARTATLLFGQDPNEGTATVERVADSDRELMDGIVPYDPPESPPEGPRAEGTSFSVSSCQYPANVFDAPVAYRSYEKIVQRIDARTGIKPRFMLFVGDQVYVDPTAGLYDPTRADDRYGLPYGAWLRQPAVRDALRRVPSFMLLDDHEIDDNWEPLAHPDNESNQQKLRRGRSAYLRYQRGQNETLESFKFDGFHFFLLDTRTERSHRKVGNLTEAALFSRATMHRLTCWLESKPGPKFVVSPAMLLPRHREAVQHDARLDPDNLSAIRSDGWDGYPGTLREVLAFIAAKRLRNIVFLSGDEHRGCIATANLFDSDGQPLTTVHSVHTSAMYAPFAFANSLDEDVVLDESITIEHGHDKFRCVVHATRPPPGDGATFIRVHEADGAWKLDCEFADGQLRTLFF